MSWIRTEICCNRCKKNNTITWQLPDRIVLARPDENLFVFAKCEKDINGFTITFTCKHCGESVELNYSKEEFDNIKYTYIE